MLAGESYPIGMRALCAGTCTRPLFGWSGGSDVLSSASVPNPPGLRTIGAHDRLAVRDPRLVGAHDRGGAELLDRLHCRPADQPGALFGDPAQVDVGVGLVVLGGQPGPARELGCG